MKDHPQAGRASRVVRDALICMRCEQVTHYMHAAHCPSCGADALQSALSAAASAEHQATAMLGQGLAQLGELCCSLGRCSIVLAASCRQQGDEQAAVLHETRADTLERYGWWAFSQALEVGQ